MDTKHDDFVTTNCFSTKYIRLDFMAKIIYFFKVVAPSKLATSTSCLIQGGCTELGLLSEYTTVCFYTQMNTSSCCVSFCLIWCVT